jgi:TolB-like protein
VPVERLPRRDFRVHTRRRNGYEGALMVDVQLKIAETGAMVWAQTFSDEAQADAFQRQLEDDLESMDDVTFRRKYGVPASA